MTGRVIPHEFVIVADAAHEVRSVDDGVRRVWPGLVWAPTRLGTGQQVSPLNSTVHTSSTFTPSMTAWALIVTVPPSWFDERVLNA